MCPKEVPSPSSTASDGSSTDDKQAFVKHDASAYPKDWPGPGDIDLHLHDLPHFSSSLEWWYLNAHLDVVDEDKEKAKKIQETKKSNRHGKDAAAKTNNTTTTTKEEEEEDNGLSVFCAFFRAASDYDEETNEFVFVHAVLWAISDHSKEKYYNVSFVDPDAPEKLLGKFERNKDKQDQADKRLSQAMIEVLKKGHTPYPDRCLKQQPLICGKDLHRLPADKDSKEYQQWKQKLEEYQALQQKEQQDPKNCKNNKKKKTPAKKKKSSCCFRKKNVLESVAQMTGLPLLSLVYDDNTFCRNQDGSYTLHLEDTLVHHVKTTLKFQSKTPAVRNGVDGVVDGDDIIQDFFYYCLPNCEVSGTVSLPQNDHLPERYNAKVIRKNYFVLGEEENEDDDMQEPLEEDTMQELQVKGIGWYDHQFGAKKSHKAAEDGRYEFQNDNPDDANVKSSYTWISLQLDNGNQMCLAKSYLHDDVHEAAQNKDKPKYYGIMVSPTGEVDQLDPSDFDLIETGELWVSMRTFRDYPTNWEISVPSRDTNLQLKAAFDNQEFPTMNVHPHFWEGAVKVKGTFRGQTITGKGFVERKGFCPPESMTIQHFFKVVSRETLKSCRKVLPFNPEGDDLNKLVCHKDNAHYTEHIDSEQFSKALVEPIRAVMDRGGKSWRSYAALACCDVVGGDSQPVKDWLALPELVHVGSLIVDDVEDRSTIRRGGPCSHLMYGEDVAINAGTMAYFLGQMVIYEGDGDAQKKVDIYNMYFEGIRAAHSGQAMDIHGLDYMMPDVVENGGDLCRQRVVAIHRLKSAAPVSFFSKIGAKLGGGSKAQSDALGDFFEALGIAFQIVDDVLNLRGFTDGLKTKGEDITAGKVTYPVAKAMCRLEKEDRAKLWEIVSSRPEDIETIGKAVALIEKVNGIEGSFQDAKDLIEDGWKKVDPLLIDSFVKINLRAFSLYILDRTY